MTTEMRKEDIERFGKDFLATIKATKAYYWGCISGIEKGHYLWRPGMRYASREIGELPEGWQGFLDGGLCPKEQQIEGQALLHHLDGWTALAFWDRSMDTRPGSNSLFLAQGTFEFEQMLMIAEIHFPVIKSRFKFSIFDATPVLREQKA